MNGGNVIGARMTRKGFKKYNNPKTEQINHIAEISVTTYRCLVIDHISGIVYKTILNTIH